jgi:hypothetical protein
MFVVGISLLLHLNAGRADSTGTADKRVSVPDADAVFRSTKVWTMHLRIAAEDWKNMQPPRGPTLPGMPGFGPPANPQKPAAEPSPGSSDVHKTAGFGMEFPWVHGDVTAEGKTFKNVGIRYKGNFTYLASSGGLRRSLKIDFDHYDESQRFHGLKTINLNSGITDPARTCESLAFAVFRAAGVPAPRTAYAEVMLSVPGKYDQECVGLYTLIEQVDEDLLKAHFKTGKGLLLKPEGLRGLEYLGEDWAPYEDRYRPKGKGSQEEKKRFIQLARLIQEADDDRFRKEIASYLDVDAFLRFLAANALLANLDSFLGFGHNYYLYLRPDTQRFVFIPWDVDLAFGKWPMGGPPEQQANLSLAHPHPGENRLIDRLLAIRDVQVRYQALLKELATTCFTQERLAGDLDALERVAKAPLARDRKAAEARAEAAGGTGFGPPGGMFGGGMDLRTFLTKRTDSVAAQLAGKSRGFTPGAMPFGPGPGQGGGPGAVFAKLLLQAGDANRDGKLSHDELMKAAEDAFGKCDKDHNGVLDEEELSAGLSRLLPAPQGPGGPPRGPGGPPQGPRPSPF